MRALAFAPVLLGAILLAPPTPARAAGCTGAAPADLVYLPNVTKTLGGADGWVTPFIVQNIGTAAADLEVSFFLFSDGSLVTCRRISGLRPHASWADIPNNDLDLPDNTQFAVQIRAYGSSISAIVNEQQGSLDAPVAMSYVGASAGATRVYLPNITRRFYGYDTPFIVQNLGSAPATVTASFVSFDGAKRFTLPLAIEPARAKPVDPNFTDGLVDGTQYAVTLTSDEPIAAVVNEFNPYHPFGTPLADSYNGFAAGDGATDLYVGRFEKYYAPNAPCCAAASLFNDSPIVVQNMDAKPVTPSLILNGSGQAPNGGPAYGVSNMTFTGPTLAPGASWAFDPLYAVGTTTPCAPAPPFPTPPTCVPDGVYTAHVHGDGLVAARATLQRCCYQYRQTMSFRAEPAAAVLFLPNVVKTWDWSGGWNSFIYLTGTATSFTASWYRFSDGELVTTQTSQCEQQGPQGCVKFGFTGDPRDDPNLPDATQYSVVITATGGGLGAVVLTYRTCGQCGDGMGYEAILSP